MSTTPRLLRFNLNLKAKLRLIFEFSFRTKREERPRSPSILNDIVESLDHNELDALSEKEITFDTTSVDVYLWQRILRYCEVIDIIHLAMTCHTLALAAEDDIVWYSALLRIAHQKRLSNLGLRIQSLSRATLRGKAILAAQMDVLSRDSHFRPFPHMTTQFSLQVTTVWSICFCPGGEWLVLLCRFGNNLEGVMICNTDDPRSQPCTYLLTPHSHLWSSMRMFTSDRGDLLLLLRSNRPHPTRLGLYQIHLSDRSPQLEMVWVAQVPQIDGCAAQSDYIAYGWIDRSDAQARHFVRVLRLSPSYRNVAEHVTMEVECQIGRWPHSYGLRHTNSQITVIIANTELIAAYEVPPLFDPLQSPCKPRCVTPFWRFSCTRMRPRWVYLVPSLPAIDTPSAIICYQNRNLFLTPDFDADPPGLHPSYFLTCTSPRGLKRPLILGPQRAFWDLGRGRVGTRTLPTPLHPGFSEDADGDWDMSGINIPESDLADEVRPIAYSEDYEGRVMMAAWDEESGKLALLPEVDLHEKAAGSMRAFIVNLIQ